MAHAALIVIENAIKIEMAMLAAGGVSVPCTEKLPDEI